MAAQVDESGKTCLCKDVLALHVAYEIVTPSSAHVEAVDNEIGTVFEEDGLWKIRFKKLQTPSGKQFEEIHSGNVNAIVLPTSLAGFTFFRIKQKDSM